MPSSELTEWMAMFEMEPWGETRADLRSGIISATLVNVHRPKGSAPAKPRDFMPNFDDIREQEELEAKNSRAVRSLLRTLAPERKK